MATVNKNNLLYRETSPYLLQHKDNPVNWYAWYDEAFRAARDQRKPIFLSIGYSTCYWCHVMEKDSFEIQEVADVLNKHFVAIKVDREERPDIDQIYMDVVTGISGQGGWPLSVFLTPDLQPFWGGTFFYRAQFVSILQQLAQAWNNDAEQLKQTANKIMAYFNYKDGPKNVQGLEQLRTEIFAIAAEEYKSLCDNINGGFGGAPKFPPSMQLSFLLREAARSSDEGLMPMIEVTLERMAHGGIFDHLAGGFHRYSVDSHWFVPHFEKMLYDNALLATTYLEAYQFSGKKLCADVGKSVLDYMLTSLRDERGGFYAAQDAGEVGREGEYYLWKDSEVSECLSADEYQIFCQLFGVSRSGNFEEGENILHMLGVNDWQQRFHPLIVSACKKLLAVRLQRRHPHLDNKIITAWNGLAISALCTGFTSLGTRDYLLAAQSAAYFLKDNLYHHGKLLRSFCNKPSDIIGCLDDYAFLIEGLINLYEKDLDFTWLEWARELQANQDKHFWDDIEGGYFYSAAPEVIIRKKDYFDSAIPAANAVALLNLLRLENYFFDEEIKQRSVALIKAFLPNIQKYPTVSPKGLQALQYYFDRKSMFYGCTKDVCALPQLSR